MAVLRWALVMAVVVALPLCAQQQGGSSQQQSDQQPPPPSQPTKSSTQDLPSAPMPQPTAGQKKPEKVTTPPPAPPEEPADDGPYGPNGPADAGQPPRSAPSDAPGASSSKDDKIDITPPANDAKAHPDADENLDDTSEFHPFDPHHAAKDIEVGDFYFKRQNYEAAISRYREALLYKPNDAIATYSLAEALEKSGNLKEALANYQNYLKILPYGPKAGEAHKALARLKAKAPAKAKPAAAAAVTKPSQ